MSLSSSVPGFTFTVKTSSTVDFKNTED
jgi:hypothetical protein